MTCYGCDGCTFVDAGLLRACIVAVKIFRVKTPLLGVESHGRRRDTVMIPIGAEVRVPNKPIESAAYDDVMIEVEFNGRALSIFVDNLDRRTVLIREE